MPVPLRLQAEPMTDTKLIKGAGEHWVASVLCGLGWAAALTRDGLERTDILAVHVATGRMIEVQVKAATHSAKPNWRINQKAQQPARSDREWFVLVALATEPWAAPRAFVAPRDHVAAAAWIQHQDWLTAPGIPAGQRNAGFEQARIYTDVLSDYESRWDLLDRSTTEAPVLLPARFRELANAERVGLPEQHSWARHLPSW
jgi:hypothetical protein